MAAKLKNWDTAEQLTSEEAIARYWGVYLEKAGDDACPTPRQ